MRMATLTLLALALLTPSGSAPASLRLAGFEAHNNFGVVLEGALLRSGAPSRAFLEYVRDRYGVRTVVDLRNPVGPVEGPLIQREERWTVELGLNHINYPMPPLPDADRAVDFVQSLVAKSSAPVLVHCQGGKDRTGTLVALIRLREGRDYQSTLEEMERYRHNPARLVDVQTYLRSRFAERQKL